MFDRFFFGRNPSFAPFSAFHFIFLAFTLVAGILLLIFARHCSDKKFRLIVLIAWIVIVLFEIGKQINWAMNLESRTFVRYEWSSFPFQFCSLPFYIWPFTIFMKDNKYRTAINMFIGTYVFFAGFGYLFVGSSIVDRVFIAHQTMIHHGLQAIISLFIFVHEYKKFNYKIFLQSTFFLVCTILLAIVLNVVLSPLGSINLCEMNPLQPTTAPVFGDIVKAVGFVPFVIIYLIGFFGFGNITYWSIMGIIKLIHHIQNKRHHPQKTKMA